MEEFHKNFPSYEKEYYRTEEESIKEAEEYRKRLFHLKYPTVSWHSLQKQDPNIMTDDACIHYKDILTNNIYSWQSNKKMWKIHSKKYQGSILSLFSLKN